MRLRVSAYHLDLARCGLRGVRRHDSLQVGDERRLDVAFRRRHFARAEARDEARRVVLGARADGARLDSAPERRLRPALAREVRKELGERKRRARRAPQRHGEREVQPKRSGEETALGARRDGEGCFFRRRSSSRNRREARRLVVCVDVRSPRVRERDRLLEAPRDRQLHDTLARGPGAVQLEHAAARGEQRARRRRTRKKSFIVFLVVASPERRAPGRAGDQQTAFVRARVSILRRAVAGNAERERVAVPRRQAGEVHGARGAAVDWRDHRKRKSARHVQTFRTREKTRRRVVQDQHASTFFGVRKSVQVVFFVLHAFVFFVFFVVFVRAGKPDAQERSVRRARDDASVRRRLGV